MSDAPITQRDLQNAVESATLAVQVANLIKDVGQLSGDLERHEQRHEAERTAAAARHEVEAQARAAERTSTRRFRITTFVALSAVLVALFALLAYIAAQLH